MKRFLLVCEGPSDISIFESVAKRLGGEIVELSPNVDATTGSYPPQGWTMVREWCRQIGGNRSAGNPLDFLMRWKRVDGVIIQIDSDIADLIKIGGVFGRVGDVAWCEAAIDNWLAGKKNAATHYIVCNQSTENWILATYSNFAIGEPKGSITNYEVIPDAQVRLVRMGYKKKNGTLLKSREQYLREKYGPRVAGHLKKVMQRCPQVRRFAELFRGA